jgi:SAM-dependent methyltransferase
VATHPWLRDHLLCPNCGSKPRERALMRTLEMFYPDWKEKVIHESSPINRGASVRLARECTRYISSQLFGDIPPGMEKNGVRCEDLERLTFADASIDLHVTQDVMEHVFNPGAVFREIARTLRPGGAHVFTVPIVNKHRPSQVRAVLGADGQLTHLLPPVYHGNPVSSDGALVTVDWGFDICRHIFEASGLYTHIVHIDDLSRGIRAEYIEVLVTVKPGDDTLMAAAFPTETKNTDQ